MDTDFLIVRLVRLVALLPALTLHEFAHAYSAYRAGDPTPQMHGRLTLNPLAHLDPIGTLMILFGPIGWAKPVPINPANFRHPSRDIVITSAAGPLSNLAQGIFWGLIFRVLLGLKVQNGLLMSLLLTMTMINFVLALFNLIPLGPLDGHHILEYKLPYETAIKYRRFNQQYGFGVLVALILVSFMGGIPILTYLVFAPSCLLTSVATGIPFRQLWQLFFG